MKRVLIAGANSYIGTSFERYINEHFPGEYDIQTVDMIDGSWRERSFAGYDCVFHVAGIAHSDRGKISTDKEALYYAVNTDLTVETAQKAQKDGVRQFIFMSSAIVYGDSAPIGCAKMITEDTPVSPANCYGDSKVQAENGLRVMNNTDFFKVVILRPPMIYGAGSKGNYSILAKLALKLPIFPYVENQRSILYVENLCEFVRLMIANEEEGTFWPQNDEYINTSMLVAKIAQVHNKKLKMIKGMSWALKLMSYMTKLVNKAFGSITYDKAMSAYRDNYIVCSVAESIERTEKSR